MAHFLTCSTTSPFLSILTLASRNFLPYLPTHPPPIVISQELLKFREQLNRLPRAK